MQPLKKIINRYIWIIALVFMVLILCIITVMEFYNERRRASESAARTFDQMEQLLAENQRELAASEEEYSQTCLHNAEAVAYMIQDNPRILGDIEELKKIAGFVEVDEIHIFDSTGRIYAGTHPQYYDFTFDSGEQMQFFKPMLEDKSLKLVQEVTPNTAEGKWMQYSAVWSGNGKFIVQVGMEPVNVLKATAKNEISYIFSQFRVDTDAAYYAISMDNGEIVGATDLDAVGKELKDIGLDIEDIHIGEKGFHAAVNGVSSYCVFTQIDSNYIGRIVPDYILYQRIPMNTALLALCLVLIAVVLVCAVSYYMNQYVVEKIYDVNEKLGRIARGDLEETVDIHSSVEFSELSSYINEMVRSLLSNNEKISYVLSKTHMYIGVYEYNENMERVRFTEYIPRIFHLEPEQAQKLSTDYRQFKAFIERLRRHPVVGEKEVYRLDGEAEQYVKLEEISNHTGIFGVVIDVTEEIIRRRKIEEERDTDPLTGLYNRRGMEQQLSLLFQKHGELGCGALFMIDADGLKGINDTYGHEKGDIYLKKIAEALESIGRKGSVAGRVGGDEFVLFLYQYARDEELYRAIRELEEIRDHNRVSLGEEICVPISFSFGYSMIRGERDYLKLLNEADMRMYENKRERKTRKA